jgi:hypothetical protein
MVYLYDTCGQISDFCHQQLLRKMRRKISYGRNLIFGHKLHIGTPFHGKRFWTHQIPTSCLPTLLIFIHIEDICSFIVAFFSATIDGRNLIFGHKLLVHTSRFLNNHHQVCSWNNHHQVCSKSKNWKAK